MSVGTLDIGISQEELREQVIARAADKLVASIRMDQDGARQRAEDFISAAITEAVDKLVADTVTPHIEQGVESLVLRETNRWGETKGGTLTFREYVVRRVDEYMTELVDMDGKGQSESRDSYGWRGTQTRVSHMVNQHLHWQIKSAIEAALKDANAKLVGGIEAAVKAKLGEVRDALKVDVKVR